MRQPIDRITSMIEEGFQPTRIEQGQESLEFLVPANQQIPKNLENFVTQNQQGQRILSFETDGPITYLATDIEDLEDYLVKQVQVMREQPAQSQQEAVLFENKIRQIQQLAEDIRHCIKFSIESTSHTPQDEIVSTVPRGSDLLSIDFDREREELHTTFLVDPNVQEVKKHTLYIKNENIPAIDYEQANNYLRTFLLRGNPLHVFEEDPEAAEQKSLLDRMERGEKEADKSDDEEEPVNLSDHSEQMTLGEHLEESAIPKETSSEVDSEAENTSITSIVDSVGEEENSEEKNSDEMKEEISEGDASITDILGKS